MKAIFLRMKYSLLIGTFLIASCTDDLSDIERELKELKDKLGTGEPALVKFTTTHNISNEKIIENEEYSFKATPIYSSATELPNGTFDIYVERFSDVERSEAVWFKFILNSETGTITSQQAGINFYDDLYGIYIIRKFDPQSYLVNNQPTNICDVIVHSFDPISGNLDVFIEASTTEDAPNNMFVNQSMNLVLKFKGKLNLYSTIN